MHTDQTLIKWYQLSNEQGTQRIALAGNYTLAALEPVMETLADELTQQAANADLHWDLTGIQQLDTAGMMMLWHAWKAQRPKQLQLRTEHEKMFERLEQSPIPQPATQYTDILWPITSLGRLALLLWQHTVGLITLIGQLLIDAVYLIRHPVYIPWREISANLFRTGAQALGITALVGFLIGIVLSYLSSKQLQLFGADIFIINILGISITRELGPMLAAILVAGRSGSSMTAQLGVMRVTQELDALTVMGISHSQRLVLPKIVGLGIAMPLLVMWTSTMALLGGMVAAELQLGLSYQYFITALPDTVPIGNLWLGLGKGVVCGMVIALIACHFGLRIKPNTESLGEGTTTSVVTAITMVIIVDAIFAVIFSDVGLTQQ
ncbi:phospholipid/cholesterol/gamma-HCH transport system permease protein [Nitrosomonas sp. Nm84]|uniref:ABC transporter permease n=1 Tax=Nitrosomonas sp. Nm84 TaxID=200124 RepID=UPI000D77305E|nr:ABC transporter permease [Nitrosomonas sp. Nm84]PXW89867.1 phospholipid/cholesterol/gamma-HCH transport system permease protein [Nitrosomonas sp. Nm84]